MKKQIFQTITAGVSFFTGAGIFLLAVAGFLLFVPRLFSVTPYIVMSGSMEPAIRTGGVIYVNTNDTELNPGDVITFRVSDKLVTHRVIRIDGTSVYTKGDANDREDPAPVQTDRVIGKVDLAIPYLGYLAAYIQSKQGMVGMLFLLFSHMLLQDIHQKLI